MWLAVAAPFNTAIQNEGITDVDDLALVFAGLINTISGHMVGALGPEFARQILEQAREGCSICMRAQLTVVPK
ncbi:hypothetical protein D3C85_929280 [compost metagenome]